MLYLTIMPETDVLDNSKVIPFLNFFSTAFLRLNSEVHKDTFLCLFLYVGRAAASEGPLGLVYCGPFHPKV